MNASANQYRRASGDSEVSSGSGSMGMRSDSKLDGLGHEFDERTHGRGPQAGVKIATTRD